MAKYMFIDTVVNTKITIVEADDENTARDNFAEGTSIISTTETEKILEDLKEVIQ